MSRFECPYCKNKVSYWEKLKPGLTKPFPFVVCKNCKMQISDFWVITGPGIAMLFSGLLLFRIEYMHSLKSIPMTVAIFIIILLYCPLRFELREITQVSEEEAIKRKQEEFSKKMEFSWKNAIVLFVLVSAGFIGLFACLNYLGTKI